MLEQRAVQLVLVLNDQVPLADHFTPSFLTAVSDAQIKAISASFVAQYGKAVRVVKVQPAGPNMATIEVEYDRAIATIDLTV